MLDLSLRNGNMELMDSVTIMFTQNSNNNKWLYYSRMSKSCQRGQSENLIEQWRVVILIINYKSG